MGEVCGSCEYWNTTDYCDGWCKRFPKWEYTNYFHCCGEFKEK